MSQLEWFFFRAGLALSSMAFIASCAPLTEGDASRVGGASSALIETTLVARPTPVPAFAADAMAGDRYGESVAVAGELAVIGVPTDGSVYLAERTATGWEFTERLKPSRPASWFGGSVATDGEWIVVGAEFEEGGAAFVFARSGDRWVEDGELPLGDTEPGIRFGSSVAISNGVVVVGAPRDDRAGSVDNGSASVFTRGAGAWRRDALLVPDVLVPRGAFGSRVAISGETIVVAARDESAAYVFERVGADFAQVSRLVGGTDVAVDDDDVVVANGSQITVYQRGGAEWEPSAFLGTVGDSRSRVAVDGDTVLVGLPTARTGRGRVSVFERVAGIFDEPQVIDGDLVEAQLGTGLAIDADVALFGAPNVELSARHTEGGFAYAYTRDGGAFVLETALVREPAAGADLFGDRVAMGRDVAIVSATEDNSARCRGCGAAYLYTKTSGGEWTQEAKVRPAEITPYDRFGVAVDVDGDTAIVGANTHQAFVYRRDGGAWPQESVLSVDGGHRLGPVGVSGDVAVAVTPTEANGFLYVFERSITTWSQVARLSARDPVTGWFGQLGANVAIDGDVIVAGTPEFGRGRVFVFARVGSTFRRIEPSFAPDDLVGIADPLFGSSVALSAEHLAVGCPGWGRVYVYARSGATFDPIARIDAPAGSAGFGESVSVDSGELLVGDQNGHAHLYAETTDGFAFVETETIANGLEYRFGRSVAIADGSTLVGARNHFGVAPFGNREEGAAYFGTTRGMNALGSTCMDNADCGSGFCVDGVCCESACVGTCDACGEAGMEGECVAIDGAPRGDRAGCMMCVDGVCDDGMPGGLGDVCADDGECGSGHCVDGFCCERACTGDCKACDVAGSEGMCEPISGAPHGDRDGCDVCLMGACTDGGDGMLARGESCSADAECIDGHCVDGVCCQWGCAGTCKACAEPSDEGYCVPISGAPRGDRTGCLMCDEGACVDDAGAGTLGALCTSASECESGACTDGVCCERACRGTCKACAEPGFEGMCVPVSGAPRGDRDACSTCDAGVCSEVGTLGSACGDDSLCESGFCVDGVCCERACRGTCKACGEPGSEGMCVAVSGAPRGDRDECSSCDAGVCVGADPLGAACAADGDCESGFCTDGVCCERLCAGTCKACGEPGLEGMCVPVSGAPRGARTGCVTCDVGVCAD